MDLKFPKATDYADTMEWYKAYEVWRDEYNKQKVERIASLPVLDLNAPTDAEVWLMHYKEDDNLIWKTDTGHLQNIIEYLIEHQQPNKGEQNA